MHSRDTTSPLEQLATSPARLTALGASVVVMLLWLVMTIQTGAEARYQIAFVLVTGVLLMLAARPVWLLYMLLLICVCDVTGYLREGIQFQGFLGLPVGGKQRIPEMLSILIMLLLAVAYLTRQRDFRQPLVMRIHIFFVAGVVGTALGVHRHIATNAFRDSLAYYCSAFFIVGMVFLTELTVVRRTRRIFIVATVITACLATLLAIGMRTTAFFYAGAQSMFFSFSIYLLLARLFTRLPHERKWPTLVTIAFLGTLIFVGRSRTGVLGFLIGILPIFLVVNWQRRIRMLLCLILPLIAIMLLMFAWEESRGVTDFSEWGARGLTVFTRIGEQEYDPTGNYRLVMWKIGWNGFLENPILGKGYGWLVTIRSGSGAEETLPAAIIHNSLLHILACGGLVGFLPLVGVITGYFSLCFKQMRRGLGQRKRLIAACAMGIAMNFFFAASANVILETVSIALVGWLMLAVTLRLAQASEEELDVLFGSTPAPLPTPVRPKFTVPQVRAQHR